MKNVSAELLELLASRQFWMADLITFTLFDGTILRYCSGDKDVTFDGNVYSVTNPAIYTPGSRIKAKWQTGLEVDTLSFDVVPGTATVETRPFLSAVREGLFDGADVLVQRAYMPTYGDVSAGVVIVFNGRVTEISADRAKATFNAASYTELLNINFPRNLYQAGCVNTLYDGSCGLNPATFAVSGLVTSTSTQGVLHTNISQASAYFDLGKIIFSTGQNAALSRGVRSQVAGVVTLTVPLPSAPQVGDAFTIYPGCDKMFSTCQTKFSNTANFRGFPFLPENSTAI